VRDRLGLPIIYKASFDKANRSKRVHRAAPACVMALHASVA
jgi:3-deoxy-D-manno-octulosonic acid (KDO) 8-phosphate synthase